MKLDKSFPAGRNLVNDPSHWDPETSTDPFQPRPKDDFLRLWIERYASLAPAGDCIEIGCFPGQFLEIFGGLGFRAHGIDLVRRVREVPKWLQSAGVRTGDFWQADFATFDFPRQYEIVCSFGFLEHFEDWDQVLVRHAALVSPGGLLFVEAPNFAGLFQRILRKLLDPDDYRRHHPAAMYAEGWAAILDILGFEVMFKGPLGNFDFWAGRSIESPIKQDLIGVFEHLARFLRAMPETESSLSSGYLGLVARRPVRHSGIDDAFVRRQHERIRAAVAEVAVFDASVDRIVDSINRELEAWCAYRDGIDRKGKE
jgi:2-polyprenyl-3-methyl-5-hydroxy-6-metoxy-1,4-benzoquinol methylase